MDIVETPEWRAGGDVLFVARGKPFYLFPAADRINDEMRSAMASGETMLNGQAKFPHGNFIPLSNERAAVVAYASRKVLLDIGVSAADVESRDVFPIYPLAKGMPDELVAKSRYAVRAYCKLVERYERHSEPLRLILAAQQADKIPPFAPAPKADEVEADQVAKETVQTNHEDGQKRGKRR